MKRIVFIAIVLLFTSALYAQRDSIFYKHEVKFSYGIYSIPNGIRMYEKDTWKGGLTVSYMYRVVKWFWVGGNINWQFPSDIEYYNWREYYADGSFKDFEISARNNFLAIAPELRFSYTNKKWVTLYSALSAGYGIQTGIYKNEYWYWNITYFGANFHIGKQRRIFAGVELGIGFKGSMIIHGGYRF